LILKNMAILRDRTVVEDDPIQIVAQTGHKEDARFAPLANSL
jgi:hypothetical protein